MTRGITKPTQWYVDKYAALRTDHHPITLNIKEEHNPPQKRWDIKNIDWSIWSKELHKELNTWMEQHKESDSNTATETLTKIIQDTANRILPTKTVCQHSKAYFNDELKELLNICHAAKKKYYLRSDPNNWNRYQTALDNFIKKYVEAEKRYWNEFCQELLCSNQNVWQKINSITKGQKASIVQPLKDSNGTFIFDDTQITKMLENVHIKRTHCDTSQYDAEWKSEVDRKVTDLLAHTRTNLTDESPEPHNQAITQSEIEPAIKSMKPKSSPGPDQILPSMIINAADKLLKPLEMLFNRCWSEGVVPRIWKKDN